MRSSYEIPIQVIAHCTEDGRIQPLRFRFEDHEQQMHTMQVLEILDTRDIPYVGAEGFRYLCKAEEHGTTHLYELNFDFRSHRWVIAQKLY